MAGEGCLRLSVGTFARKMRLEHSSVISPKLRAPARAARRTFGHWLDGQRGLRLVVSEIEIVLNERSTDKGVVADTIAADPRIEEREGEQENQAQEKLRLPGAMCGRCAEFLQAHR